jgi:hypothetical protein
MAFHLRLGSRVQAANGEDSRPVFVAEWKVKQEILDCRYSQLSQG